MAAADVLDKPCTHLNFDAHVNVGRIQPEPEPEPDGMPKAFVADVLINCADCGIAFVFPGVGCGLSYDEPRVSVNGTELRVPVRPSDAAPGFGTGLPSVGLRLFSDD